MRSLLTALLCSVLGLTGVAVGQTKKTDESLLDYVPKNIRFLTVFRPQKTLASDEFAKLKQTIGERFDPFLERMVDQYFPYGLAELEEIDAFINATWLSKTNAPSDHAQYRGRQVFVLKTVDDHSEQFDLATHSVKSEEEFKGKTILQMTTLFDGRYSHACIVDDRTIVWASDGDTIKEMIEAGRSGASKSDFFAEWTEFQDHNFTFVLQLSHLPADALQQTVGGTKELNALEYAVGGFTIGADLKAEVVAACQDRSAVEAIEQFAQKQLQVLKSQAIAFGKSDPTQQKTAEFIVGAMDSIKTKREREKLIAKAKIGLDFLKLKPMFNAVYDAHKRGVAANHARQQALGMHNYESAFGEIPRSVMTHESGKKYSWRIAILPFIGRQDIYDAYDFTQDWDSPHNLKVTAEMPDLYRSDIDDADSTNTSFFLLTGAGGAFGGDEPLTFNQFRDGTSNTVMAIEAKRDVHWAKPEDIPIEPESGLPDFGGFHKGGFNIVRVDGSTQFIPSNVSPDYLRLLFSPNDGQPVPTTIPLDDDE